MLSTKTSRDVGMVDGVCNTTGSCMENQLVEKSRNKEVYTVTLYQLSQQSPASRHTLDTLSPSLHLATFSCGYVGSVYHSALLPSN